MRFSSGALRCALLLVPLAACNAKSEVGRTQAKVQVTAPSCDGRLRCQSPKLAAKCAGGVTRQLPCRGPAGCVESSGNATCDNALALTGDACDEEHDFGCALDRKAALECQQGTFRVVTHYRGIDGCVLDGDEIECTAPMRSRCDDIEDIACCLSFARLRQ
jgi:hypothetical protein